MTDEHDSKPFNHAIMSGDKFFNFKEGIWQHSLTDECCYSDSGCVTMINAAKKHIAEGVVDASSLFSDAELVEVEDE